MTEEKIKRINDAVSVHPDFPKPGIDFKNIFPVLRNPSLFKDLIDVMVESVSKNAEGVKKIVGLDARGFLFGPMIAQALGIGFVPVRKAGKLPGATHSITYKLEYGQDTFEVEQDSVKQGEKVVIVDDLLATGGTMKAAYDLVNKAGGEVLQCLVVMELVDLRGRDKVPNTTVTSLIKY
ncbi:adenine phosphoribosyltransferase-like [Pecten maximus]|uniref:adenine phosphoribosyltransferase-like n=1 Tax=Pecten maximus TaxID=6579 RepID=UPI001458DB78|nr:adenine phosphoribosyltransferase-like [Pecten maximus]XP_033754605.1 adenine phosphoribosyltransferase-like [Pecten maximus]